MWRPSGERTRMDDFRETINEKKNLNLGGRGFAPTATCAGSIITTFVYIVETYNDLRSWSVQSYGSFWEQFFTFSGIKFSQPHEEVSQCVQCNIHHTVACYKSHDCIASDQQIVMS